MALRPEGVLPYRRVLLYFTTGTGNAYRAAKWVAERATVAGCEARVVRIEDAIPERELDGTAGYLVALILALKGYAVRGVIPLDMPSNWMSLHPGFRLPAALAMVERQRGRMARFSAKLLAGGRAFHGFVSLAFGLALLPLSLGYLAVGRFFFAKLFFASRRCNGCGLCARACARDAIEMRGAEPRPYWTWRCESCMQCMAFCPRHAVEASQSLAVLVLVLGAILPLDALLVRAASRAVPALAPLIGSGLVGSVLWNAYLLALLFLLYAVLAVAARFPLVRAVLEYTTLTRLYHRYREPDTRLRDVVSRKAKLAPAEREI